MPGTLPAPSLPTLSVVASGGSTLPAGGYFLRFSITTPWGESSLSSESTIQTTIAGQGIQVDNAAHALPLGAATLRAYFGIGSAGENQFVDITSLPFVISAPGTPGILPTINRAYLPDTDGVKFPAITIYSWIKDALNQAADFIGGIYDVIGVNTTNGIAMYPLLGSWKKMSHAWVDGWVYEMGNKGDIFYRNKITTQGGGICVMDVRGIQQIIEYYPNPDRSGGATTLSSNVAATDTTINLTDTSSYLLQYGLALIGTEIIAYQVMTPTQLQNCIRGLGGTTAQAWLAGQAALELNGRFAGWRYPSVPRIGQASLNLDVPTSWESRLQLYIESRYREAERRFKDAADLRNQFMKECKELRSANRSLLGPKQVGETQINEVYNAGLGGGWLLP